MGSEQAEPSSRTIDVTSLLGSLPQQDGLNGSDKSSIVPTANGAGSSILSSRAPDPTQLLSKLRSFGLASDLSASDLSLSQSVPNDSSSLSGSSSSSSISVLLSRLSLILSDVSRLLESHISSHLPLLLQEAERVQSLQGSVHELHYSAGALDSGVSRLRAPLKQSLRRLKRNQVRLRRLGEVHELVGRAGKFTQQARRLEASLRTLLDDTGDDDKGLARKREQALVRAAGAIQAIDSLTTKSTSHPPLASLNFVASYLPSITAARTKVVETMEQYIVLGLRDLDAPLLSCSLSAANSLGVLRDLIRDLMADLTDVVRRRVENAFAGPSQRGIIADALLSGGASEQGQQQRYASYRSQRQQSQQQQQQQRQNSLEVRPQQLDDLHARLTVLFHTEMTAVCSKIYLLERVLRLMGHQRADTGTGTLLDEALMVLQAEPTDLFWRTMCHSLNDAVRKYLPAGLIVQRLEGQHTHAVWFSRELSTLIDGFFERTSVWTREDTRGQEKQRVRECVGLA